MTIPKCTMCGNLHTGECPQRPGANYSQDPLPDAMCGTCGAWYSQHTPGKKGMNVCATFRALDNAGNDILLVTRAEFDALRRDLAIVARRIAASWDAGAMFGPPGEWDELRRIAESK